MRPVRCLCPRPPILRRPSGQGRGVRRYRLGTDPAALRAGLALLTLELARLGLRDQALTDAEIVLAEVLNNIGEHAYGGAGGWVDVALVARAPGGVCCLIRDRGRPLPAAVLRQMAAGPAANMPCSDQRPGVGPAPAPRAKARRTAVAPPWPDAGQRLAEGGYGLGLIAALAASVEHRRLGASNWLRLTLPDDAVAPLPAQASSA